MLVHWIWLATRPGLGDRGRLAVLRHFQDPELAYFADPGIYDHLEGVSREGAEGLMDKDLTAADEILRKCMEKKIRVLTYQDAAYPARLKNIADPPVVLYYKGQLPEMDRLPVIGAVGTRQATLYGLNTAKRLGYQIARCGGVLVSGMAAGIDAMAMRGALTGGQCVVGVLGCGVDLIYPLSNRSLFADVENYGCILSEFPPGTPPSKWNFPKRNRIISGLSCGVLVVEAPAKSGALITARQASEQGRDVFAVPGNIDVPSCVGSNALLRDGAIAVSRGWDILSEYVHLYPDKIRQFTGAESQAVYPDEVIENGEQPSLLVAQTPAQPSETGTALGAKEKKVIDNGKKPPYIDVERVQPLLTEQELRIVDQLAEGERLIDDVIAATGLPAGTVLSALTLLEINGIVTRLPGKRAALRQR